MRLAAPVPSAHARRPPPPPSRSAPALPTRQNGGAHLSSGSRRRRSALRLASPPLSPAHCTVSWRRPSRSFGAYFRSCAVGGGGRSVRRRSGPERSGERRGEAGGGRGVGGAPGKGVGGRPGGGGSGSAGEALTPRRCSLRSGPACRASGLTAAPPQIPSAVRGGWGPFCPPYKHCVWRPVSPPPPPERGFGFGGLCFPPPPKKYPKSWGSPLPPPLKTHILGIPFPPPLKTP